MEVYTNAKFKGNDAPEADGRKLSPMAQLYGFNGMLGLNFYFFFHNVDVN